MLKTKGFEQLRKFYLGLGIPEKDILAINKELALTAGLKLSPFARPRRVEMLKEALLFPKGKNQEKRAGRTTLCSF